MLRFAVGMMMNERTKFLSILLGLICASIIMTVQSGVFFGLLKRAYSPVTDASQPDIWVMERGVKYLNDYKYMKTSRLYQVRSVEGVAWAVPMYRGLVKARLRSGLFQDCDLVGIDSSTLIGGPPIIERGAITDLREPNGVILNTIGVDEYLTVKKNGKIPLQMGSHFQINDHNAKVVGFCRVSRTILNRPIIYTTFDRAHNYSSQPNILTYVLVKAKKGVNHADLCAAIKKETGLTALTSAQYKKVNWDYYLYNTPLTLSFFVVVVIGFGLGVAITGQTFYNFAHDNRHYFATLKAMGANNTLLAKMILIQGLLIALLSWTIGLGATSVFGYALMGTTLSFNFPWWLFIGSGVSLIVITLISALFGLRKIIRVEPGIVFSS